MTSSRIIPLTLAVLPIFGAGLGAQVTTPARPDTITVRRDSTRRDTTHTLGVVKVIATQSATPRVGAIQQLTLPVSATITADRARQTVNLVDPEDAVKYLPSVYVRKRNYGDTQATLATRTWGVSSSARSLVFADGVPLTALVANNNTIGGPRWGLVSPEEIARVDMMYGPFSAAYAGNSMGAVMEITTRQPTALTGSVQQAGALQHYSLYGTHRTFGTAQTSAIVGDRFGDFSFWASGNVQDSHSQPLLYVTSASSPQGTTGGYAETNKLGAPANVLGATGMLHTRMANARVKLAYDLSPTLRAAYTTALWRNDASSGVDSYLDRAGQPTFASQAGFATGSYDLAQRHTAHSLSLRKDGHDWHMEAIATTYRFGRDQQRFPVAATAADTFGTAGRIAVLDGTGWQTADLKGAWHRGGMAATHLVTFGLHGDRYRLFNPTYDTSDWRAGDPGAVATEGDGRTRTLAAWAQDAWRLSPALRLTIGARGEWWRAHDGYNANGGTAVSQPEVAASRLSPKATLAWEPPTVWSARVSVGKAYRFATPAELYQLVSTGATFTAPDPRLRPDDDLAVELRGQRLFQRGSVQLALFQDDVRDAIIAQYLPLVEGSPTLYQYLANVDHVRSRGVELTAGGTDLLVTGLGLSASATWLDARTLALSGAASASAPAGSAVGRFLPNIPKWRANFQGLYHPPAVERLALTVAGRYSTMMYTTLDNADVHANTYQGFGEWFVMDARASYDVDRHWSAALGVDNLLDRKYFLFHPFPQRTLVGSARYAL